MTTQIWRPRHVLSAVVADGEGLMPGEHRWVYLDTDDILILCVDEDEVPGFLERRRLCVMDQRGRVLEIPHGSEQWPPDDLLCELEVAELTCSPRRG